MEITTKKVKSSIRRKFIKPLNDGIKYNINKLDKEKRVKYNETISLLKQSYQTLNNVEMLLKSDSIVDANSLLRSSFEYILVGMMVQFDNSVFNEFINLSIDDNNERDSTKILRLINRFKTHLNEISAELFEDFNRVEKGDMLTDLYNKLSKFTHGSLFVTTLVEIKNKDDIEMLKMLNYQNFYFVKILLFCCLKYFTNDKKHYIEENNFGFCIMFNYLYIGERLKNKEMTFKKYDEFLYKDKNKKYFEKNKKYVEKIQKETLYLNDEKIDDKKFMEALKKFLK